MIRVGVADDQPLVRAGLRTLLATADDVSLVG
jgi:DNA-binding NarL/FixJ family response regulator